jgi:hypothetical protein
MGFFICRRGISSFGGDVSYWADLTLIISLGGVISEGGFFNLVASYGKEAEQEALKRYR